MNEIYWINGVERPANGAAASLAQVTLNALMETTGIQPAWVDAVYWLGGDIFNGTLDGLGLESHTPVLNWPGLPLMDHFILHSAARSLITQEAGLVIVGQQIGDVAAAALLGSSEAVKEHHITPRANLTARLMLSPAGSPLASIRNALESLNDDSTQALACIAPVDDQALQILAEEMESFNPAVRIKPAPSGVIVQLNVLVEALQGEDAACGLLVSAIPRRPMLATLVMRV